LNHFERVAPGAMVSTPNDPPGKSNARFATGAGLALTSCRVMAREWRREQEMRTAANAIVALTFKNQTQDPSTRPVLSVKGLNSLRMKHRLSFTFASYQ
jgi:hypothetical protein